MDNNAKYKFLTYLFLLLSVFVLFLFSKNIYSEILQNNKEKQVLLQKIEEKNQEYASVAKIKSDIDAGNIENADFEKFLSDFSEDEVVEYFYAHANTNKTKWSIESLSLSEGSFNEFGIKEARIDINAVFATEKDLMDVISALILNSPKYNLYIHQLNYPMGSVSGPISVSLPIKLLYK